MRSRAFLAAVIFCDLMVCAAAGEPRLGDIASLAGSEVRRDYRPFMADIMAGKQRLRGAMVLLSETGGSFDMAVKDLRRLKSYGANHVRLYFNPTTGLTGEEVRRYAQWIKGPPGAKDPRPPREWWRVTGEVLKRRWLPLFAELDLPVILMVYTPEEVSKDPKGAFWTDAEARKRFVEDVVAEARFFKDEPAIIGFDVLNEPIPPGCREKGAGGHPWSWSEDEARRDAPGGERVLADLYDRVIRGVREFDRERLLVLEPGPWGLPWAFPALLGVADDPRLVFSCHQYEPHGFSHWGKEAWQKQDPALLPPLEKRPKYPDAGRKWDRKFIAEAFDAVESFRKAREKRTGRHCPIWIGEFGTWRWLDKASQLNWYMDTLALMEERGYGWAYFVYDAGLSMWWNCMTQDGPEGEDVDLAEYLKARKALDRKYFEEHRKALRPSFELVVEAMKKNLAQAQRNVRVTGAWSLEVDALKGGGAKPACAVVPAEVRTVERERHDALPLFDAAQSGWRRGLRLLGCQSQETSVKGALEPGSVKVYASADAATPLTEGKDYRLDAEWATVGRLPGGAIGERQPAWVSYRYGLARIDSVVEAAGGGLAVRRGTGHVCVPRPPATEPGDRVLANVWIPPRLARLTDDQVFPILETAYPEPPPLAPDEARRLLPRTWKTLESGGTLRVLAWGDSVTDAGYLKGHGYPASRWQEQFAERLRKRFPRATVELTTAAWGGHGSRDFAAAPAEDKLHHYPAVVLGAKPDLIVSEFVNDAYLGEPAALEKAYGRFRDDFRKLGAEWIVLAPHYVRPDWMNLKTEKGVDQDPRPYVRALRGFCAQSGIPLADASVRWGRLWRQGIPYTTLLLNAINHPDERGMAIYADSLMRFFPQP